MSARLAALGAWLALASGCFLLDSPAGVEGAGRNDPYQDDDDDDDALLVSGTYYPLDDAYVDPMTCGVNTASVFSGFESVDVFASSSTVELDFDGATITFDAWGSNEFLEEGSPHVADVDFMDPASAASFGLQTTADCLLISTSTYFGEAYSDYDFELFDDLLLEYGSGAECSGVATSAGFASLPCQDTGHTTWSL